jgi:hypothetical protein
LANSSHKNPCHSLNAGMPWNSLCQIN